MNNPYLRPEFSHLLKEYESVVQCNRCGFCETVCPTYTATGKETLSPRGRNQALRHILEGKIADPLLAEEIFTTCLTCQACTNVCFSEVPVARLMGHARSIVRNKKISRFLEWFIFHYLLFYRRLFSLLIWMAFFFKRMGISFVLKKSGLLKILSPELDAAEELISHVPLKFGAGHCAGKVMKPDLKKRAKVAYFSGCGIHYLYPNASKAILEILENEDCQILCPNHSCCGLPAQSAGDIGSAKRMAQENIRRFMELDADIIVVTDDSCCGFMKHYPLLLLDDKNLDEAAAFSKKIMNLSQFLMEHGDFFKSRLKNLVLPAPATTCRVTYHDPCQMGNGHRITDPPRKILKSLPGLNFVEMEESNWCCGGAGAYCLKHPRLSKEVLERKISSIKESGAEIVLTQASSCLMHIQYGLRKSGCEDKIQLMHLGEFIRNVQTGRAETK